MREAIAQGEVKKREVKDLENCLYFKVGGEEQDEDRGHLGERS